MSERVGETITGDGRVIPLYGERRRLVTVEFYTHESAPPADIVEQAVRTRLSELPFIFDTSDLTVTVEPVEVITPEN